MSRERVTQDIAFLRESGHFDAKWYLAEYPDVAEIGMDPVEHYVRYGVRLLRKPSAAFDTTYYLTRYRDVAASGLNPFVHFLRYGRDEGRAPAPPLRARANGHAVPAPAIPAPGPGIPPPLPADVLARARFHQPSPRRDAAGKPRVLLVAHLAGANQTYGGERSFLDMVGAAAREGFAVYVAVPRAHASQAYLSRLLADCIEVVELPYRWWRDREPLDEVVIRDFSDYLASRQIDLVHSNTIMLREPLVAARRSGRPALVHVREIIDRDPDLLQIIGESAASVRKFVAENADVIVANSQATAALFDAAKLRVVPNCVDLASMAAPPRAADGTVRFGLISSNLPKKGVADFVALARACREQAPNARFVLIGPETDIVRELVRNQPDAPVEVTGYMSDAAAAIASVDVILNFSHFAESFGRTVLEGMAAARPSIVYDHGALPELVRDGESGFVVPYQRWDAAVPHVVALSSDEKLRERLGRAAAERAKAYGFEQYAASLGALYRDALAKAAKPAAPKAAASASETRAAEIVLPARRPQAAPLAPSRIAYFQWHFPVPSETFVLNELRWLKANGFDVRVFCRQSPHKDFKPDFDIDWEIVATPEALAKRLKETGRQVVNSHFTYPTVTDMVWPACEQAGVRFTFFAHAQDIFRHANDEKNRIGEVTRSAACERVFVAGRFHEQYLLERGVPAEKITILPQGIDVAAYPFKPRRRDASKPLRIAAVHRFTEKKGLLELIEAVAALPDLPLQLDLYGYGPDEAAMREKIAQLGQGERIRIVGSVDSREALVALLHEADLFATPCKRASDGDMDGIPTVLMEAMAAGCLVATTPTASIPELVIDGVTGLVCEAASVPALVEQIRAAAQMPAQKRAGLVRNARRHVERNFDTARLVPAIARIWSGRALDVVIVSWNNLPQLKEVIARLYRFTRLPFHLTICDNGSAADVQDFLRALHAERDNVTIVFRGFNSYVGPGTNRAVDCGSSDYVVYVCGKEGFVLQQGWDRAMVDYMESHPRIGLAGSLGYSPSYLHGRDYPKGVAEFAKFRNPEFAQREGDRVFRHVQGGFFAMRRKMYAQIGGFSDAVPHNYTDVEYSYYVESRGWELGEIPGWLALYNKTRPGLRARLDDLVLAAHPPMLEDLQQFDAIAARKTQFCNVCEQAATRGADESCSSCGSTPQARTLKRFLAESVYTHRRLRALIVDAPPALREFLEKQFRARWMTAAELAQLHADLGERTFDLALICGGAVDGLAKPVTESIRRALATDGALIGWADADAPLPASITALGDCRRVSYYSAALRFADADLIVAERRR